VDSPSETDAAKRRSLRNACLTAIALFAVAAIFSYLAYLEIKTGTAPGTTISPLHAPSSPTATRIDGIYSREKDPGYFWGIVIFYIALSLIAAGFGGWVLWCEFRCRRREKLLSEIRADA